MHQVNGEVGDAVTLLKKAFAWKEKALRLRLCRPVRFEVTVDLNGADLGLVVEKFTGTVIWAENKRLEISNINFKFRGLENTT